MPGWRSSSAGRLRLSARLADDDIKAPTSLILRADRNSNRSTLSSCRSAAGESITVDLAWLYAVRLASTPTPSNATLADVAHVAQYVELFIAFSAR